jgi:thiamine-phosphate pyrophosphorylase
MRGLYAIVDAATLRGRKLPITDVALAIARARPAALQLRAKGLFAREVLELLRDIHPICRDWDVPLFANDRLDLALLAGCEGVHLGQGDVPIDIARRLAPQLKIGVSTHTLEQVDEAALQQPDYIAFGPVFATRSKTDSERVVGLDGLSSARQRTRLPLVAIGGIDVARADVVGRVCQLGAAIAALVPDGVAAGDLSPITARVRELHARLAAEG